jgi:spore germination protein KB
MVLLMVYITHLGGITAIGRFSQIVGPIFFVVIVASILLNLPNIDFHHIMPVYADHGMIPIMKASVIHGSFLSESILVMILIPLLLKPKKAPGTAVLAVSISSVVVIITTAMVIMTFGPQLSGNFINPYFNMVRFISALDFIQNMDVWVVFIWLFCVFIKLSMYMFITSYGTAQWLHIRNWKKVIWYLGAFYLFVSIVPPNIAVVFTDYLNTVWLPLIFWPNMIIIPLIMLGISFVKKPK